MVSDGDTIVEYSCLANLTNSHLDDIPFSEVLYMRIFPILFLALLMKDAGGDLADYLNHGTVHGLPVQTISYLTWAMWCIGAAWDRFFDVAAVGVVLMLRRYYNEKQREEAKKSTLEVFD